MASELRKLLDETHGSTLRQEVMIEEIQRRLESGDGRFESLARCIEDLGKRMTAVEQHVEAEKKYARRRWAVFIAAFGAMCLPAFSWFWEKVLRLK